VVFLLALAVLAGLAVLSWALDRSSTDEADVAEQPAVVLPNAAENARLIDENVNHPDVVGDVRYPDMSGGRNRAEEQLEGLGVGAGTVADVAYPDGVLEAADVQLSRSIAVNVNPELSFGRTRAAFLEQNVMLPGDVGHLDDRAVSMEEIRFLEVNTWFPDGGAVALIPPGSDHAGMGMGFSRF
jgi:hypothetical protein